MPFAANGLLAGLNQPVTSRLHLFLTTDDNVRSQAGFDNSQAVARSNPCIVSETYLAFRLLSAVPSSHISHSKQYVYAHKL